jgi:hypothetical protein
LKDIRSGALPASEIPGFIAWAVGKSFWLFFAIKSFWLFFAILIIGLVMIISR